MSLQITSIPFSESSRAVRIQKMMGASIFLSLLIIGFDAPRLFSTTFFAGPGPTVLTLAHHITILALAHKQRRASAYSDISVVGKLGTVVCQWLLFVFWVALWAISIVVLYFVTRADSGDFYPLSPEDWAFPVLFSLSTIETGLMLAISIECTKERKVLVGGVQRLESLQDLGWKTNA